MPNNWKEQTQKEIRKTLKVEHIKKEMTAYNKLGPVAYTQRASKLLRDQTGIGTRAASSYWILDSKGNRFPMKALGRMAALREGFTENSYSDYWIKPFDELGFSIAPTMSKKEAEAKAKCIKKMIASVKNTVCQSNGQERTVILKNKLQKLTDTQLKQEIERLIEMQDNKCALTGLPFDYDSDCGDEQMLPSLDRIDSDAHYELGNLQIVCRFANFWKGSQQNSEFLRLLNIVREESEPAL